MKRIRLPHRLFSILIAAQPLLAGLHVMDFNDLPSSGSEVTIPNPRIESFMRLSCTDPVSGSPSTQVIRYFPNTNTGQKSASAKFSRALFSLTRPGGGAFTMESIRLFPFSTGSGNGSVTFTGYRNGNIHASATFTTGTSLSGGVWSFSGFDDIDELRWEVNNNLAGKAYHQFDDITVELPPLVTVPPDITLSEGMPSLDLTVRREAGATGPLNLGCTWAPVTATTADLVLGIGSPHTFSFSGSEETKHFSAIAANDTQDEPAETAVITWDAHPSYILSAPTTTITIGDTDAANYYNYVNGHGLTGNDADPDADPNGDGVSNIVAYACGLNPAGPFPTEWRSRLPRFTTLGGGRSPNPAVVWTVLPTPPDVEFIVRESSGLTGWTEVARRKGFGVGSLWIGPSAGSVQQSSSLGGATLTVPGTQKMNAIPRSFLQVEMKYSPPGGAE